MKKPRKFTHGGSRKGLGKPVGRPRDSKSSTKVKFMGTPVFEEEKAAILAAAKAAGMRPTAYVVKCGVLAWHGVLKEEKQ